MVKRERADRFLVARGLFESRARAQAAIDAGQVTADGRLVCLDVGSSTGGFTEALLARGARHVYAVHVGRDQLHPRLHNHPQVTSIEQTDIRNVRPSDLPESADFAAVNVRFISLKLVLPHVGCLLTPSATLLALIKPQFEAGRRQVKKGIVREPLVVCDDIARLLTDLGWRVRGRIPSSIPGGDGNREFFIGAERG